MSAFDFCLFTTIWDKPKEFDAGRFAADILAVMFVGMGGQEDIDLLEWLRHILTQISSLE